MNSVTCSSSSDHGPDLAVEALTALGFEFGTPQRSTRSVLDTFDGRLHRASARLDARPVYKPGSADAVELSPHGRALPDRPLVVGRMPHVPGDLPSGQFRFQLASIVRERALLVQLTMTSQCAHAIRRNQDGKAVALAELHTDVEVIDGGGSALELPQTWCLELHELPEHRKHAARTRRRLDKLGLRTIESDSLGWAAAVAGVDLAGFNGTRSVALRRKDTAADGYRRVLHQLGDLVSTNWQGTADDVDPEFLHDLRVALRRSRTVLDDAHRVLPDGARTEALGLAGSLAEHTGAPRDLDVHVLEWESYVAPLDPAERRALEPVRELLVARQKAAHVQLTAAMAEADRERWIGRWRELVDTTRAPDGTRPPKARRRIGRVVAKRVELAHGRLVSDGRGITPSSPDDEVHRLRKDAKRLRYLLESFGSLVANEHRRTYTRQLKAFQDHLGALQDTAVHRAELDDFGNELREARADTLAALAALTVEVDQRYDKLRGQFADAFTAFDSTRTRRALREVLADLRR